MDWVEVPFEVQKPQHGLRVDAYLAKRLHRYSRAQVQKLIDDGRVELRGRPVKASTKVADGDTVVIRYEKHHEPPCPHEALPVLYEDEHLVAVNKPGSLLSHPTDKVVDNTATSVLKKQFGRELKLVHRLDRDTSGVLVLAKSREAARALTDSFFERSVEKTYWALVRGRVAWKSKVVDAPIGREGLEIKVRQAVGEGQSAVTELERLAAGPEHTLVAARPKTGRLHQIRVHLAHLGHPLLGDRLYTGDGELYMKTVRKEFDAEDAETLGAARQMLHARSLSLPHPVDGRRLTVDAPLWPDFLAKLAELGLEAP